MRPKIDLTNMIGHWWDPSRMVNCTLIGNNIVVSYTSYFREIYYN